ncbi:hypothetical protein ACJDU8_10630 [Clostridium sp. WILCCON 0269]|uniref:Uncharacterized protein n=1 Tax=Candidatus Clostridium eludens TaxID=3381663 RepID=A0ABW8SJT2_9CLOT
MMASAVADRFTFPLLAITIMAAPAIPVVPVDVPIKKDIRQLIRNTYNINSPGLISSIP